MKSRIVRRQFAKVDEKWADAQDLQERGVVFERSWSSFCIFFPAAQLQVLDALRKQNQRAQVDLVSSSSDNGVWVMGSYFHLELLCR